MPTPREYALRAQRLLDAANSTGVGYLINERMNDARVTALVAIALALTETQTTNNSDGQAVGNGRVQLGEGLLSAEPSTIDSEQQEADSDV